MYHHLATVLIAMGRGMVRAGEDAPTEFWLLKASILSFALREFHASEARVIQADEALLTSKFILLCARIAQPSSRADLCFPWQPTRATCKLTRLHDFGPQC